MSIYPYKPLDTGTETRVLEIEPGNYDDKIFCSLKHISLLANPKFEALSYCWGNSMSGPRDEETLDKKVMAVVVGGETDETITEELVYRDLEDHPQYQRTYYFSGGPRKPGKIHCDDIDIMVGGELYSVLKRLRPPPGSDLLVIWIDAVCINQFDLEERKLHVRNMSKIYENAEIVRIWLGEEVGNETQAFKTLKEVAEKMAELFNDKKFSGFERQGQFLYDQKIRGLHWDSLSELLGRSWVRWKVAL